MNLKEKMAAIKAQIKDILTMAAEGLKLEDGTAISTNEVDPALDVEIFTIDGEGSLIPMVDGDYTLDDGMVFSTRLGKIASWGELYVDPIEEVEAPEVEVEVEQEDLVDDKEARIAALELTVAELMDMMKEMAAQSGEMMTKLNKISKAPAADPIKETRKEKFSKTGTVSDAKALLEQVREYKKTNKDGMPSGNITLSKK